MSIKQQCEIESLQRQLANLQLDNVNLQARLNSLEQSVATLEQIVNEPVSVPVKRAKKDRH